MASNVEPQPAAPAGPVKGEVGYLQIPARDITRSAEFYEHVFGWQVDAPHPSFEAPNLIGQWVKDRAPAGDGGMLAWIHVDNIQVALENVRSDGGQVLEQPVADGRDRWLATIKDPAGNVIGIVQQNHG
jgi:hypothetical protein